MSDLVGNPDNSFSQDAAHLRECAAFIGVGIIRTYTVPHEKQLSVRSRLPESLTLTPVPQRLYFSALSA